MRPSFGRKIKCLAKDSYKKELIQNYLIKWKYNSYILHWTYCQKRIERVWIKASVQTYFWNDFISREFYSTRHWFLKVV